MNCSDCKHAGWKDRTWIQMGRAHLQVLGCAHHIAMLKERLDRSLARNPELMPTQELIELGNELSRKLNECQAELDRRADGEQTPR
jgi:hypothetical protein